MRKRRERKVLPEDIVLRFADEKRYERVDDDFEVVARPGVDFDVEVKGKPSPGDWETLDRIEREVEAIFGARPVVEYDVEPSEEYRKFRVSKILDEITRE